MVHSAKVLVGYFEEEAPVGWSNVVRLKETEPEDKASWDGVQEDVKGFEQRQSFVFDPNHPEDLQKSVNSGSIGDWKFFFG